MAESKKSLRTFLIVVGIIGVLMFFNDCLSFFKGQVNIITFIMSSVVLLFFIFIYLYIGLKFDDFLYDDKKRKLFIGFIIFEIIISAIGCLLALPLVFSVSSDSTLSAGTKAGQVARAILPYLFSLGSGFYLIKYIKKLSVTTPELAAQQDTQFSKATSFSLKRVLIAIGVVILVFVLGFIALALLTPKKENPFPNVLNTLPAKKDETAGWKTYSSKELGIEFKYPTSWNEPVFDTTPKIRSTIFFQLGDNSNFGIGTSKADNNSIENLANRAYKDSLEQYPNLKSDQKKENFNINDHNAILVSYIFHPATGKDTQQNGSIFIPATNNRLIAIYYSYSITEAAKNQQLIFDQIISSLKIDDTVSQVAIDLPLSKNLIGIWQESPGMAAGWNNRYQFFSSGKYNYRPTQMFCGTNDRGNSGYWKLDDYGNVELTMVQKIILTGERKPDDFGGCGSLEQTINIPKQIKTVTISQCKSSESDYYFCLFFDGAQFYKFSSDSSYGNSSDLEREPVFK